jgi:hypothetical protein
MSFQIVRRARVKVQDRKVLFQITSYDSGDPPYPGPDFGKRDEDFGTLEEVPLDDHEGIAKFAEMHVDNSGESVVALAAEWGTLNRVAGLLTSEMLMLKTMSKRTALSCAVAEHCLDRIQPGVFLPGWMRRKFKGRPLAQILVEDYLDYVSSHLGEFHEKVRSALLARLLAA